MLSLIVSSKIQFVLHLNRMSVLCCRHYLSVTWFPYTSNVMHYYFIHNNRNPTGVTSCSLPIAFISKKIVGIFHNVLKHSYKFWKLNSYYNFYICRANNCNSGNGRGTCSPASCGGVSPAAPGSAPSPHHTTIPSHQVNLLQLFKENIETNNLLNIIKQNSQLIINSQSL